MPKLYREIVNNENKQKVCVPVVDTEELKTLFDTAYSALTALYHDSSTPQNIKEKIDALLSKIKSFDVEGLGYLSKGMSKIWMEISGSDVISQDALDNYNDVLASVQQYHLLQEFEDIEYSFRQSQFRNSRFLNLAFGAVSKHSNLPNNPSSEYKIEWLANYIIQNYREVLRSWDGENDIEKAETIQKFCKTFFGIDLPTTLEQGEYLSLYSLILNDKKSHIKKISHRFYAMIGQSHLGINFNEACSKEEFLLELKTYSKHHEVKPIIDYTIEISRMLTHAVNINENLGVSPKLQKILTLQKIIKIITTESEFGKIISKYYIAGMLPRNIQEALDKKYNIKPADIIDTFKASEKEIILGNNENIEIENAAQTDFANLILKFERMAKCTHTRGRPRIDSLRQAIATISNKESSDDHQKIEMFINSFLKEYRSIIRSHGGEASRLAEAMREFSHNHLGISNLPKTLEEGKPLNLYSLIYDQRNPRVRVPNKPAFFTRRNLKITENPYCMISEYIDKNNGETKNVRFLPLFSKITHTNYFNDHNRKDDLIIKLKDYKSHRLQESDTHFIYLLNILLNFILGSWNPLNNFMFMSKWQTTNKLLDAIEGNKKVEITRDDEVIMNDGRLGGITESFRNQFPDEVKTRIKLRGG